jgi:hypothetical protein
MYPGYSGASVFVWMPGTACSLLSKLVWRFFQRHQKFISFPFMGSQLTLPDLLCLQIEGDHPMDAVFSSICRALDTAAAKIDDPLEDFCNKNPSELECLVYED